MADLTITDKRILEAYFEMRSGFLLDFTNQSLRELVLDTIKVDLYDDKYDVTGGSKAKRMRAIWDFESNTDVAKLIRAIIAYDDADNIMQPKKRDLKVKSACLAVAVGLEGGLNSDKFRPHRAQAVQGLKVSPSLVGVVQDMNVLSSPSASIFDYIGTHDSNEQPKESLQTEQNPPLKIRTGNLEKKSVMKPTSNKVFIVHGHDELVREKVARYVTNLGLEPIILYEQYSASKTIIEKIEAYAEDVVHAIILYTPCDEGKIKTSSELKDRARQNVVFEHGYFIGKLGRPKVTALVSGDIDLPNDFSGVVYISFDQHDGWKMKLASELKGSGIEIDMNKAFS